jgi:hypothetical protein
MTNGPPYATLNVMRLAQPLPAARYLRPDDEPHVLEFDIVEVPVTHQVGNYHIADVDGLGEHSVVNITSSTTDFRTTDHDLAVVVAETFHREGV